MLCAVTPYLMPQPTSKIANLGDGFIVRAIERLLGKFPPALTFTSRALPASEQISQMQKCSWVILAGANQLTDDFTVWPAESIEKLICAVGTLTKTAADHDGNSRRIAVAWIGRGAY